MDGWLRWAKVRVDSVEIGEIMWDIGRRHTKVDGRQVRAPLPKEAQETLCALVSEAAVAEGERLYGERAGRVREGLDKLVAAAAPKRVLGEVEHLDVACVTLDDLGHRLRPGRPHRPRPDGRGPRVVLPRHHALADFGEAGGAGQIVVNEDELERERC